MSETSGSFEECDRDSNSVFVYDSGSDSDTYFSGSCSVVSSRHHSICSAGMPFAALPPPPHQLLQHQSGCGGGSGGGGGRRGSITPTKAKNITQAIKAIWHQVEYCNQQ